MKKYRSLMILFWTFIVIALSAGTVFAADTALPPISSSRYLSTYTYSSSGKVEAYTSSSLSSKTGGYIDCGADECRILAVQGNAVQVSYPVSSGRKTAWFSRDAFTYRDLAGDGAQATFVASRKITTYRWKNKGTTYGYIASGDVCFRLRGNSSSDWVQVIYPTGNTWKMAWIHGSDLSADIRISLSASGIGLDLNGVRTRTLTVSQNYPKSCYMQIQKSGTEYASYADNGWINGSTKTYSFTGNSLGSTPYRFRLFDAAGNYVVATSDPVIVTVTNSGVKVTGVGLDTSSKTMTVGENFFLRESVYPSNATNKSVTWSSSNTSVATVNSSGYVTAKGSGSAYITVRTADGGYTASCYVYVNPETIYPTGISLNQSSLRLNVGNGCSLTATVHPSNATNKNVTWSSSNTSVAAVSSSGYVSVKGTGTATISARTVNGYVATCSVSGVTNIDPVYITSYKSSLWDGEEYQMRANRAVSWTSSNTAVASINSSGLLRAIKKGTAVITASADGKTASVTVTVDPISTGNSVKDGYYLIAYAGNTDYVLDVSGASCDNGANIHLYKRHNGSNQKFRFTYQNNGYYSILNYGSGQAVNRNLSSGNVLQWPWHGGENEQWALESAGDGYFYIRSRSGNYLDNTGREIKNGNNIHTYKRNQSIAQTWKLIETDNSIPVKDLSLNKKKLELTVGETASLKETIIPSNATNKGVTWSSSNKKYATVDKTGKVKGIKAGDVTITVKSANGKTAACKITVIDPDTFVWPVGGNGGVWNGGIDYPRYVRSKAPHTGTDIQAKKGTAVRSAYAGKIVSMIEKRNSKGQFISFGRYIIVESKVNGKKVRIYYCHLSAFANVKVGQTIKAGTKIGKVGMTGNATGNHLHFEVRKWNGSVFKTVNPTPYLDKSKKGK